MRQTFLQEILKCKYQLKRMKYKMHNQIMKHNLYSGNSFLKYCIVFILKALFCFDLF